MISMDKEGDSTILFRNSEGILWQRSRLPCVNIRGKERCLWRTARRKMGNPTSGNPECDEACHGLFPKRLVMEAACLFAHVCR